MTEFEKGLEKFSKTKEIGEWGARVIKGGIRLYDEIAKEFKDWKAPKPLPAIPQYVADEIEREKRDENSFHNLITSTFTSDEFDNWNCDSTSEILMRARLDGYTIEVEKKYYLKNKVTGSYLRSYPACIAYESNERKYDKVKDVRAMFADSYTAFTQEQIDTMDIGSYEKIEVDK